MSGSKYQYVKSYELADALLPNTFLVIRIDGKGFHAFSKAHKFVKPNDKNALDLMNEAARRTMQGRELNGECVLAFGESDEFSFVFKKSCKLYGRRASKLTTLVTSLFTSAYIFLWPQYFPNSPLVYEELPVFDGRIVQYPSEVELRDYLRWRQVDTHINNMYNTCFWSLVQEGGLTEQEAHKELSGTISSQKQELLFSRFKINYNNLPAMFRKGSLLIWELVQVESDESTDIVESSQEPKAELSASEPSRRPQKAKSAKTKPKRHVVVVHEDFIAEVWWESGRGAGVLKD
ncbi:tRNAHis guanylyltransferase [Meredithblackwellia eburnea MCA 4105]